jgi:alcohol dehydrogenase class IV
MVKDNKMARMAHAMGLASGAGIGPAIRDMSRRLGLPAGLRELGVSESLFPQIIKGALADHSHKTNPREASEQDYLNMLQQSM